MITIIIYDSISFIKLPMNDSKEITLFIDTYNSNHSDAVLMVADYLSNNHNSSAEIIVSEKNQLNLKIMNNNVEGYLDLNFDLSALLFSDTISVNPVDTILNNFSIKNNDKLYNSFSINPF